MEVIAKNDCISVFYGRLLPNNALYDGVEIYKVGTHVIADTPIPLLYNHDVNQKIGNVYSILVKEDGLYYVAEMKNTCVSKLNKDQWGVSLGGKYDPERDILFIYEVSLTDIPYFIETKPIEVLFSKNNEKLIYFNEAMTEQKQIQAQDLSVMESLLNEHEQKITELYSKIDELTSSVQMLSEEVSSLKSMLSSTSENIESNITAALDKTLPLVMGKIDQTLSTALTNIFKTLKQQ